MVKYPEEVEAALSDYMPVYVAERLNAPPGPDPVATRGLAIHCLYDMLWRGPGSQYAIGAPDREELLSALQPCLTAREILDIYDEQALATVLPYQELYDVALAGMAEGLRTSDPSLVAVAAKQFSKLERTSLTSAGMLCLPRDCGSAYPLLIVIARYLDIEITTRF